MEGNHIVIRNVCFAILCAMACSVSAQVTRQASTNGLLKIVYTADLENCPQLVKSNIDAETGENYGDKYWAIIAMPELSITNMPSIDIRVPVPEARGAPAGWTSLDDEENTLRFGDQVIYLLWKCHNNYSEQPWDVLCTQAKITLVCEQLSQPEQSLKVLNTGTGKSLALEWSTNAPNAKVEGYKVYRQNVSN